MGDPNYVPRRPGRPQKYPWDLWLDGADKLLVPRRFANQQDTPPVYLYDRPKSRSGEAARHPAANLQKQILNEAARRRVMVTTEQRPDDAIGLRFLGTSRAEAQPAPRQMTREQTFDRMLNGERHEIPVRTMTRGEFIDLVHDEAAARGVTVRIDQDADDLPDGAIVVGVQALPEPDEEPTLEEPLEPEAAEPVDEPVAAVSLIRAIDRSES